MGVPAGRLQAVLFVQAPPPAGVRCGVRAKPDDLIRFPFLPWQSHLYLIGTLVPLAQEAVGAWLFSTCALRRVLPDDLVLSVAGGAASMSGERD